MITFFTENALAIDSGIFAVLQWAIAQFVASLPRDSTQLSSFSLKIGLNRLGDESASILFTGSKILGFLTGV
jgi:hypothetical protein